MKNLSLENCRFFIAGNSANSMFSLVCEKGAYLKCDKITLRELKEYSEEHEIFSYFTNNDEAIAKKLDSLNIKCSQIREKIELDPERGDILFVVRARNFNVLKEQEIPDHVTIEVYVYSASMIA